MRLCSTAWPRLLREQGINLRLPTARQCSLQAVAASNDTIVLANYATMAQSTTQGMPVIAIGGMIQRLPDALIALKGSGIKTQGSRGRPAAFRDISDHKLFPAFAQATGIDLKKIKMAQMAAGATHAACCRARPISPPAGPSPRACNGPQADRGRS